MKKTCNTLAALNFEIPDGNVPEWIELVPDAARVVGRDGRAWMNDRPDDVVAAFAADGRDLPFDLEHATELKAPAGEPAPAVAWITELERRGLGVWGRVSWNAEGRGAVESRAYRYYSPVFIFEKATGRIVRLSSVGLTNRPNLRVAALNHESSEEETPMLKKILKALGLAEDATEDAAMNAITDMQGRLATALNRAETPSLAKFVPREDYDAAVARATNAETGLADRQKVERDAEITREVDAAQAAGKIVPATREYYMAMCSQENGLSEFKKFVAAAPVIGDPSRMDGKRPEDRAGQAMNAEEKKIADMFGNSAEDLAAYGN